MYILWIWETGFFSTENLVYFTGKVKPFEENPGEKEKKAQNNGRIVILKKI